MIHRLITAMIALIAASQPLTAQVQWLQREYDFGAFREEAGPQRGEVRMVNAGSEPTAITRVKSTCGCTVAGYTEGLIEPGDTATVWFTYNPAGRPGRFEKHIKVYTGTDNHLTSITIKGTVIGSASSVAVKYPVEAGPMRLSTTRLALGKVVYGRARHEYISGYNVSTDTLDLAWTPEPRALSIGVSSRKVAPGDLFTIGVYFNSRDEAQVGPLQYDLRLYPNASDTTLYVPVSIEADVMPDTSGMSEEELRVAPSAMVYPTVMELGDLSGTGKAVKIRFRVRNEGKTKMHVRRIAIPGSQALRVKKMPSTIAPGKEHEVEAEILPAFLPDGAFALEIQVITDDPIHPCRTVRLVGTHK